MKLLGFNGIFTVLILAVILAVGVGDVFGQKGRGHGGGHDKGGGRGGDKQQWGGMSRQQRKMDFGGDRQKRQDRGWQQQSQRQVWRQPDSRVWQQPQQQREQQRGWRQERGRGWERSQRQVWRQQSRQVYAPWTGERGNGRHKDKAKGRWKSSRGDLNRAFRYQAYRGDWVPPGQIRRQQVHERNAYRKAIKDQEKAFRKAMRFDRSVPYYLPQPRVRYRDDHRAVVPYGYDAYGIYDDRVYVEPYRYRTGGVLYNSPIFIPGTYGYDSNDYGEPYYTYAGDLYDYDDGFDWKSMLLRTLIGFVLGNDGNSLGYQGYDPYYAGIPSGYSYGSPVVYAGYPSSYSTYYPGYGQAQYYPLDPYTQSGYGSGLISMLPVGELLGGYGGGYGSEILRQVLAQGYEQGYAAGYYARDDELREQYVANLYSRDDDFYNPYSVSIGQNRRIYCQGYALGYQDALAGRQDYVSEFDGNADLFSLLLSNVIGTV